MKRSYQDKKAAVRRKTYPLMALLVALGLFACDRSGPKPTGPTPSGKTLAGLDFVALLCKAFIGVFIGLMLSGGGGAEPLVEGRVRLSSGQPVADAQVRLFDMTDLRQGPIARALTDGTGYFALPLAALPGRALPTSFALGPNYPNPFNPSTIIPYQLATQSAVRLEVFNLLGQRVATLVDGERPAGFHTATWHATDAAGRAVGAGVYIYRMTVGAASQTGRMVLIDGQAGVPAAGAASAGLGAAGGESEGAREQVYGLVVSGEGLVPYVDPAFRAQAGREPVEWVVEALGAVRAKVRADGLLGDVNNDNQVNSADALLVVAYSAHAALSMPNNGNILLGDVNQDGQINSTDAQLIASKAVETADAISIPDANLRAAIEAALGKASGAAITPDDMATLTGLKAPNKYISDLTGLEFATNLTELWLANNAISDLSPLEGLTNLTTLWLNANQITDLSPLAGLTNLTGLTGLSLAENTISDLSPLAGLTNLTGLWLNVNQITDLSPLAGLTNLTGLSLWDNQITDISPLEGLIYLTYLDLNANQITDISPLEGLTKLINLDLSANQITDISPLEGLIYLTYLDLSANQITDISPLEGLIYLKEVRLRGNPLSDFSMPVVGDPTPVTIPDANLRAMIEHALGKVSGATITKGDMKTLTFLQTAAPDAEAVIRDLTGLEFAHNLNTLFLVRDAVTDLSPLAGLTNLTTLWLINNNHTDLPSLASLTNLTHLDIQYNNLTDLPSLASLTNLTYLNLRINNLTDLSPLASLTNLTYLNLRINNLTDLSPLASLTNLTHLDLGDNAISDLSPLAGLTNLTYLDLRHQPLSVSSINDHIPALERSGVTVRFDPPLRESDFDIELVYLSDDFTEQDKRRIRYAARRWMSIIREDLPDHTVAKEPGVPRWFYCGDRGYRFPDGERIDDLRIYMSKAEDFGYLGMARPITVLESRGLPILGCVEFNRIVPSLTVEAALHEIGHVLGIGTDYRFTQELAEWGVMKPAVKPAGDVHFNGPLAIAAFDAAGGHNYTGKKVPMEEDGGHWRSSVIRDELMGPGGGTLSAITIQALADMGYVVDVTQAHSYTLPSASAKAVAAGAPHQRWCGVGLRPPRPIDVVDEHGRVVRTISP